MGIEIVFRGVAMFVCGKGNKTVTKVLFPNAEGEPIEGSIDTAGSKHADHTRATHHYAGLLIPRPDGDEYHKLRGFDVMFLLNGDANIGEKFIENFPSLQRATNGDGFELTLLPVGEEKPSETGRVATRITPSGGVLTPIDNLNAPFSIDGHHAKDGTEIPKRPYTLGATWTPVDTALQSVTIELTDLTGSGRPPKLIKLGPDSPKAYFYNFENGIPTVDELEHVTKHPPCNGHLVDDDWKWLYGLMDRSHKPSWGEWLKAGPFHVKQQFPAPKAKCEDVQNPLVSVSTCFQTVFEDV